MKRLLSFFLLFLVLSLSISVLADHKNYRRYDSKLYRDSYYRYPSTSSLNLTFAINCHDPYAGPIPLQNTRAFTYCVDNYWYLNANRDNTYVQLIKQVMQEARYGRYRNYH